MVKESTGKSPQDWLVVFTSTLALAVSVTHVYSTGLFIVPIETEFGWSRAQITAGLAVVSVISVVFAPFVGMVVDRIGSRRIALPGMILYCTALALLSTTTQSIWHWWAMWGLLAFGWPQLPGVSSNAVDWLSHWPCAVLGSALQPCLC